MTSSEEREIGGDLAALDTSSSGVKGSSSSRRLVPLESKFPFLRLRVSLRLIAGDWRLKPPFFILFFRGK